MSSFSLASMAPPACYYHQTLSPINTAPTSSSILDSVRDPATRADPPLVPVTSGAESKSVFERPKVAQSFSARTRATATLFSPIPAADMAASSSSTRALPELVIPQVINRLFH
ncbi:hypothetical protein BH10PSE19_BH10PSE19_15430 [soil metagenome]